MADYEIGPFSFIDFTRPHRARQGVEVESRPGSQSHNIWLTGKRGVPFSVQTWRDEVTLAAASLAYENYLQLIESGPVNVRWAGLDLPFQFDVLGVRSVGDRGGVFSTVLGVGGQLGVSSALVICQWDLIETDIPRVVS